MQVLRISSNYDGLEWGSFTSNHPIKMVVSYHLNLTMTNYGNNKYVQHYVLMQYAVSITPRNQRNLASLFHTYTVLQNNPFFAIPFYIGTSALIGMRNTFNCISRYATKAVPPQPVKVAIEEGNACPDQNTIEQQSSVASDLEEKSSEPEAAEEFKPVGDHEWASYSEHTRKIALLAFKSRDRIPSGFLSKPDFSKRFTEVEEILSQLRHEEPGIMSAENEDMVTIKHVPVSKRLAEDHDYVVEDPNAPGTPLYLDQDEYTRLVNASISNKKRRIRVLLYPGKSPNQKFPPRNSRSYRTSWISKKYKEVQPFISTDLFSWAAFINPAIASQSKLFSTPPKAEVLAPKHLITKATGSIVRYFCVLQSVCLIHKFPAEISWCLVTIGLVFLSEWYYTSLAHTCDLFKEARRLTQKYLAGTPEFKSMKVMLSIDKHGLPKLIPAYIRLLVMQGDELAISAVLFALDTPKMFVYLGADKTSTITEPSTALPSLVDRLSEESNLISDILSSVYSQPKDNSVVPNKWAAAPSNPTQPGRLGKFNYFFSNKVGPNGHALLGSMFDALALLSSPALPYIREYCELVFAPRFYDNILKLGNIAGEFKSFLVDIYSSDIPGDLAGEPLAIRQKELESSGDKFRQSYDDINLEKALHPKEGRIGRVLTSHGKVRLIAIPSYFIQVMFKPIHDLIFGILKSLPTDSTFDQKAGIERIKSMGGSRLRSFDLSAATDRVPLLIQIPVLAVLFTMHGYSRSQGLKIANMWGKIIQTIPFFLSKRKSRTGLIGRYLKYGCGHPMGTYSSWAAFTITHHLLVQICAYLVLMFGEQAEHNLFGTQSSCLVRGVQYQTQCDAHESFSKLWYVSYQMLGDDIVFFANTKFELDVSNLYLVLMQYIGVEIHPLKGFDSSNASFEFCKEFVRGGRLLTAFKWGEWASAYEPKQFVNAVLSSLLKGLQVADSDVLVQSAINLLPYCMKTKMKYLALALSPITVQLNEPSREITYISYLIVSLITYTHQVELPRWVSYCMGAVQLPDSVPPCKTNLVFPRYFKILVDLLSLITTDLSPKVFHLCTHLYSQVVTTISGYVIKRLDLKGSPVCEKLVGHLLQFLKTKAVFTAFFLNHPAVWVLNDHRPDNEPSKRFKGDVISYDLLETDPTVAIQIEADITSSDPTPLVKSCNQSYRSAMNAFILAANFVLLYTTRFASIHNLDMGSFTALCAPYDLMKKLNGLRAALVTSIELRISQTRDRVYSWCHSAPGVDVITDGETPFHTLEQIYPVPENLSISDSPSIFPFKVDLPERDPWGIPRKSIDFDLEYEARQAIRNHNLQKITIFSAYATEDSPYKSTPTVSPIVLPSIEDDPDLEEAGYIF
jgi:hypothetical protein